MKKKVAIIGAGKHAMMLKELIVTEGYEFLGYFDERKKKNLKKKILGKFKDINLFKKKIDLILLGIGDNLERGLIFKKLKKKKFEFLTFIHPTAKICKSTKIGEGSVVLMGAIINSNSEIEEAVIINSGSIIEHDCLIKFSAHICPGSCLAGNVEIGKYSFIGIGSRIIQNIKVVNKAIVGAGSIILNDILKPKTIKGVFR